MRKFSLKLFTVFAIVLCSNLLVAQITINGYSFLEHETNHQNIKIDFERTAPSSLTYTFYTDVNGYFSPTRCRTIASCGLITSYYTIKY